MQVERVVPLSRRKSKVLVDEGFAFALYGDELGKYQIEEGGRLSSETYREIEAVLLGRARERLLYLLKDRDRTEAEMRRKLRESFYPEPVIEKAVAGLRERGLLDDMEYGRRYVELYGQRRSRRRIRDSLLKKGLSREQADALLKQGEEQGEIQEEAQIREYLRKKGYDPQTASPSEKSRFLSALVRGGYPYETVCRVMRTDEDF